MKKIRVYELAKKKKISAKEAVKLLKKKGFKKISAVSSVHPNALDDAVKSDVAQKSNVSHLFGVRSGALVTASALPASPLAKKSEQPVAKSGRAGSQKKAAKAKPPTVKQPAKEDKGGGGYGLSLTAIGLCMALLVLMGFLYTTMRADRSQLSAIGANLGKLEAAISRIDDSVTANRAQLLDLRGQVSDVTNNLADSNRVALNARLKSQGAVIGSLAQDLKGPLKGKTQELAQRLSSF